MNKIFKIFAIGLLVFVLAVVLVLGYFGLVPGVSAIMGTNKPRDLGVTHTPQDLDSVTNTLGQEFTQPEAGVDPHTVLESAQSNPVDAVITQEQFSAHLEQVHPISNVQVRIDGEQFEMSGQIVRSRIPQFVRTLGITGASDAEILDVVNQYFPVDPVFYLSGSGQTTNDDVVVALSKAEIGRFPLPADSASQLLEQYIELVIDQAPGFAADSITLQEGALQFAGTATSQIPRY